MKVRELSGKEVIDSEARIVGYVKDLEFDEKKWTVSSIIIKSGFIKKHNIQTSDIDKIGDKVVLKVPGNKIQKA
jgi:sporulation protein YlmC with PRC-barrel domain